MAWIRVIVREKTKVYIQFPYADPAQVTPEPHLPSGLTFNVLVGLLGLVVVPVGGAVGFRQDQVPVGARMVKLYWGTVPVPARYQFSGGSPRHVPR